MVLHPLWGHQEQRARVGHAAAAGRLPQFLLLTGPASVGKQRFGLWVGQLLLCETKGIEEPCGSCRACRQVLELSHPDLHWIMPVNRPKAGEAGKQVEELEDTLNETLAARRENSLYAPQGGMAGHFISTARLLQRRAALTPVQGSRKVFLIAEADRLVPQEASPEAANALLKLLEEPPTDTQFVLTVTDANQLLPTIRSRAVELKLGRLSRQMVEQFLEKFVPKFTPEEVRTRAQRSNGVIGQALWDGDQMARARRSAEEILEATKGGAGQRAERALKQGAFAARGDFSATLEAMAEVLAERAREAAAGGTSELAALVRAQERVQAAREAAQGNVNPQLLLAALQNELAEAL
jgi:DNA polymerase III subunit delta'